MSTNNSCHCKYFFFLLLFLFYVKCIKIKCSNIKEQSYETTLLRNTFDYEESDFSTVGIPSLYDIEVYGSVHKLAYYYIYLNVGNPPQTQTLIIDSGSTVLSFSCHDCDDCGNHISQKFNFNSSNTGKWTTNCNLKSEDNRCPYSIHYAEQSALKGYFFTDYIALGDAYSHSPIYLNKLIGCHYTETNLFFSQMVSGIIGIGNKANSGNALTSLLNEFPKKNKLYAICLSNDGGLLTIGGYTTPKIPPNHLQWLSLSSSNSYQINLKAIKFNNKYITNNSISVNIDSGTTHSYFPSFIYNEFAKILKSILPTDEKICHCLLCWHNIYYEKLINIFPSFHLEFDDGVSIEWEPKSYLTDKLNNCVEAGIGLMDMASITLGMTFMKHSLIVFDPINNKIGLSNTYCPSASDVHTSSDEMNWWKIPNEENNSEINEINEININDNNNNNNDYVNNNNNNENVNNNDNVNNNNNDIINDNNKNNDNNVEDPYTDKKINELNILNQSNENPIPDETLNIKKLISHFEKFAVFFYSFLFGSIFVYFIYYIYKYFKNKRKTNDYSIINDQQQEAWAVSRDNIIIEMKEVPEFSDSIQKE